MASFLIGILVVFATFYLALIYAQTALGLLGCAGAVLLVLAFLELAWTGARIGGRVRIPISTADRGRDTAVIIDVENKSFMPCMKIRYRIACRSRRGKLAARQWYGGDPVAGGRASFRLMLRVSAAGSYTVTLEKIRIYDWTGLFHRTLRAKRSAEFQVLPEVAQVGLRLSERLRNFYGDSDVYDDFRAGEDASEIFDVREFRPGDKIQSIHWKLSAKSEELIVREDSQPRACPVVLILDDGGLSGRNADAFVSVAATLSFSLMDQACPHFLSWYSGSRQDMVRARVDDEEGYYIAVCGYLGSGGVQQQVQPLARYQEKYRYDRPLYTLVLRGDLTLWQNGERLVSLDGKDWRDALGSLELVL